MRDNLREKFSSFEARHHEKSIYIIFKWLANLLMFASKFVFKIGVFLFMFFVMRRTPDRNGRIARDDRNADDIWKHTSGNDYYDKEPPGPFS